MLLKLLTRLQLSWSDTAPHSLDVFDQCGQLRYLYDRGASTDLRLRCSLLAASLQPGERARVAIVASCIDGATSNPLTWCALCTEFPALQFDLFVLTPNDANHQFIPVTRAALVAPWAVTAWICGLRFTLPPKMSVEISFDPLTAT